MNGHMELLKGAVPINRQAAGGDLRDVRAADKPGTTRRKRAERFIVPQLKPLREFKTIRPVASYQELLDVYGHTITKEMC